jgi:serine/threonine protein kinase
VWKQLNHPNVLPFLGVNTKLFSPSFCLISPWMENGNALSFLEKNPDHDRWGMLLEIAQGLNYLHHLNPQVIHGDIKGVSPFTFIFSAPSERIQCYDPGEYHD